MMAGFISIVPIIFSFMSFAAISTYLIKDLSIIATHGKAFNNIDNDNNKSFLSSLRVPKQYFSHFYITGCFISLICFILSIHNGSKSSESNELRHIAITLFGLHCLHRYLECKYITIYGTSTIHLAGYLVGLFHYIIIPLSMLYSEQSVHITLLFTNISDEFRLYYLLLMIFLYVIASMSQYICHYILYQLKLNSYSGTKIGVNRPLIRIESCRLVEDSKSDTIYQLPPGFLFNYICCPHYTMEIIIYIVLYNINPTITQASILMWVAVNLSVTASVQYTWYNKHYMYEMKRRGIRRLIPLIW